MKAQERSLTIDWRKSLKNIRISVLILLWCYGAAFCPAATGSSTETDSNGGKEYSSAYKSMPLRVYFEPVSKNTIKYGPRHKILMERAFDDWSRATKGGITFRYVEALPADITVAFLDRTSAGTFGQAKQGTFNGKISSARIIVAAPKSFSDRLILHICEHEIGHALGLAHSRHAGIMQVPNHVVFISAADFEDIRRLFSLDEDGKPNRLSPEQSEQYLRDVEVRLMKMDALAAAVDEESECQISLEVDKDGYTFNVKVEPLSQFSKGVATAIVKADPLPSLPVMIAGRVRVQGTVSTLGVVRLTELVPVP